MSKMNLFKNSIKRNIKIVINNVIIIYEVISILYIKF